MRISDWSSDVCSSDLVSLVRHESASCLLAARHWRIRHINSNHSVFRLSISDVDQSNRALSSRNPAVDRPARHLLGRCRAAQHDPARGVGARSEEHTSELQSLIRTSYAVFCVKKKNKNRHKFYINHNLNT